MPYCSELFYREYENNVTEKGAAPLVLLHGSGGSHMAWPAELRRMPGRRVIAPDLPGHGQSGGNTCQDLAALRTCMREFFQKTHIRKPVLMGHSLGAMLALSYAAAFPSEIRGLVLLSCGSRFAVPEVLFDALRQPKRSGQFGEQFGRIAFDPTFPQAERRKITEPLTKIQASTLLADLRMCADFHMPAHLEAVHCPALLINGASDPITTPSCARQLACYLLNASLTVLPGCGHMLVYEKTALIQQMVRDFFSQTAQ